MQGLKLQRRYRSGDSRGESKGSQGHKAPGRKRSVGKMHPEVRFWLVVIGGATIALLGATPNAFNSISDKVRPKSCVCGCGVYAEPGATAVV